MDETGLRLTRSTDVRALASGLMAWLSGVDADPYDAPVVLTPGAGMQRWLSQQIARSGGPVGEGICAGVRFEPLARLESMVSGRDPADDPWAPERLVWRILELVEARTQGLEPLAHHLAGSEQRYANAARVAFLLDRYARLRPGLLKAWSDAETPDDLGLGFDTWQPVLWRALHACVPGPDPVRRREALLADLAAGRSALEAPVIGVFCPRQLTAPDADLLAALAERRPVEVWLRVAGPAASEHPLAVRLGSRGAETAALLVERAASAVDVGTPTRPATLLGGLQKDLALGRPPVAREPAAGDHSLRVHASHGPDRQAEVLREVLAGLFADDPTLEPRHVVVACPDPGALAPHLSAVFSADDGPDAHPGRTFRVQVVERGAAETNALYGLVGEVAQLGTTRATAGQLLSLATHPFVARRFGFGDDADRLGELVEHAAVRWGLNDAHRAAYGLDKVRQGTWQVGVQRLLLGEALSDDALASAGVIAPVDDVESSDVSLLGGLAELVSRVSRLVQRPERAPAAQWIAHVRAIVDQLADVPFDESWQVAQLWSVLELVQRRSGDSPAPLGSADALALLDAEFARRPGRPAYGDGSLVVCPLGSLAQVPHRVVCLVGLDERSFPRRGLADGDDLLATDPRPGEPDPGRDDRQAVLDAVGAAEEALVIVYQGWSSHTLERRPAPAGVLEVIEAAGVTGGVPGEALVVDEPLQPFSPSLFGAEPRSFDMAALRGARALVSSRRGPAPDRYAVGHLPLSEPVTTLDREQLRAFLAHPARYFLRERAGLTLGEDQRAEEEIPLELDSLALWQVGDRLLDRLLRRHGVQDAQHAEWLRGDLPPGNLGRRFLDGVTDTAVRVANDAAPFLQDEPRVQPIDLALDGVRLTGRAATRGDVTLSVEYSKVAARHLASAWVDALALTVALERPVDAVLFGGGRRKRLTAPEPDAARALLSTLVYLAVEGQSRVLPMPPRVSQLWAECRARNTDPMADRNRDRFWGWERDQVWDAVLPSGARPWDDLVDGEPWAQRGEKTTLGSLAGLVWRPIVRAER
jgi:exodeoxyribonuclease V gamma subunit